MTKYRGTVFLMHFYYQARLCLLASIDFRCAMALARALEDSVWHRFRVRFKMYYVNFVKLVQYTDRDAKWSVVKGLKARLQSWTQW
jgi:hypothetical protein